MQDQQTERNHDGIMSRELSLTSRLSSGARGFEGVSWLARAALLRSHSSVARGCIEVCDKRGDVVLGNAHQPELRAVINVHDPRFYSRCLLGGTVSAAESYIQGDWDCDDLVALMRILLRNQAQLTGLERGAARIAGRARQMGHALRRNSRRGSRENISAHYDLGNDFFELFLDDSMMYSSAIYPQGGDKGADLPDAQRHKLDVICQALDLQAGEKVVEIGTGWGGFAIHAAKHYGVHVTTTTISKEQHDYAARRIAEEGLGERVTLLLDDYRDLVGQYDKLVSIEMIEAVGHQYFDRFMRQCAALLNPGGQALIQAITIEDSRYLQARDNVDFIKSFVFPGGCLPSVSVLTNCASRAGLRLGMLRDYADDYASTLRDWRDRFHAATPEIKRLGYSETFRRLWHYYLCYCEAGFRERSIGLAHLRFDKS